MPLGAFKQYLAGCSQMEQQRDVELCMDDKQASTPCVVVASKLAAPLQARSDQPRARRPFPHLRRRAGDSAVCPACGRDHVAGNLRGTCVTHSSGRSGRLCGWLVERDEEGYGRGVELSARHDCQRQKPDQPGCMAERDNGGGRDGTPATPTWLEPFPSSRICC